MNLMAKSNHMELMQKKTKQMDLISKAKADGLSVKSRLFLTKYAINQAKENHQREIEREGEKV